MKLRKQDLSILISCATGVGVIVTGILSYKAGVKAVKLKETDGTAKDYVLCYAPAVASAGATILGIAYSARLSSVQIKGLTAALLAAQDGYKRYTEQVIDIYGEEAHQKILENVNKVPCVPPPITAESMLDCCGLDFNADNMETVRTFYDAFSDRYFDSTIQNVLQAEYHVNRNFALGATVPLNMFYEFLGIDPVEDGDKLCWSFEDGIEWIDFNHRTILKHGNKVPIIEIVTEPYDVYDDVPF